MCTVYVRKCTTLIVKCQINYRQHSVHLWPVWDCFSLWREGITTGRTTNFSGCLRTFGWFHISDPTAEFIPAFSQDNIHSLMARIQRTPLLICCPTRELIMFTWKAAGPYYLEASVLLMNTGWKCVKRQPEALGVFFQRMKECLQLLWGCQRTVKEMSHPQLTMYMQLLKYSFCFSFWTEAQNSNTSHRTPLSCTLKPQRWFNHWVELGFLTLFQINNPLVWWKVDQIKVWIHSVFARLCLGVEPTITTLWKLENMHNTVYC